MSEIPSSLAPFFQEYELSQLNLERSAGTIIESCCLSRTAPFGTSSWEFLRSNDPDLLGNNL